jgi:hypothetical protein
VQQSNFEKAVWSKTNRTNARGEGESPAAAAAGAAGPAGLAHPGAPPQQQVLTRPRAAPASPPAAEIVMFDNHIVCYKFLGDLWFYVTGSLDENELILYTALQAFYEAVSILLRWAGPAVPRTLAAP